MDKKTFSKRPKKSSSKRTKLSRRLSDGNVIPYRQQFSQTLTTGTTGVMSTSISPSISQSSEYSTIQALYTEVKLLACRVRFTATAAISQISHGRVVLSTNMLMNENSLTLPTNVLAVQNQKRVKTMITTSLGVQRYNMFVPLGLEYSNIVADAPATPTPWAGSPGVILFYSSGLNNSTTYFLADVEVFYLLRGRQ
jgi:hypothetical protein